MKEYIIITKERNRPNPIKTQYSGNLDKDGIIEFSVSTIQTLNGIAFQKSYL